MSQWAPFINTASSDQAKGNTHPWILLGRNEYPLFQFEVLGSKQVQIGFLLWLFLCFTFLNPFDLCRRGGKNAC